MTRWFDGLFRSIPFIRYGNLMNQEYQYEYNWDSKSPISSMEQEEYIQLVMPKGGSFLKIYQELSENQQESEDQEITLE